MGDVIADLRQAMAEFDGCTPAERAFRVHCAQRVIRLVRRLLAEVDGERAPVHPWWAEPLGPPNPAHGELPLRDDDYTPEALNRTAD